MTILPKVIIRFKIIPSKYQWHVFLELEKITLNFSWKYKRPPNSQIAKKKRKKRKKSRTGGITFPSFKLCSVQFSSVTQSCPTLCYPMNRSMPGLPVHQQLPEFTQTHVHQVGDAIQPSHPLSSPSPPAPSLSKHQGLFQ